MSEVSAHATSALDATQLAVLDASLGAATLSKILRAYIAAADRLCDGLEAASGRADWDQAARLARDIAASASGLGFGAMTAAARAFAGATEHGAHPHMLRNGAQMIVLEHERLRCALMNLYPELVG